MACGERVEVTVSYWTVCWKWFVPYPCKKTRRTMRYHYDFIPWRSRVTWPFRCKYQGCCGSSLYEWKYWCWKGTGNSGWIQSSARTEYLKSMASEIGNCPFTPPPV